MKSAVAISFRTGGSNERIRLFIIGAASPSSLRGGRRALMGSGGERVLRLLQGYRERVLETRLSRRA